MTRTLSAGANAVLDGTMVAVSVRWTPASPSGIDNDLSCFVLQASGKVSGDADMIFFNQPVHPSGGVRLRDGGAGSTMVDLDLAKFPPEVDRLAITAVIDQAAARNQSFSAFDTVSVTVGPGPEPDALRFDLPLAGRSEAALILCDVYRRQGGWKFRAVGQGFNGGLKPLAESFGVDVADDPAPSPDVAASPASQRSEVAKSGAVAGAADRGQAASRIPASGQAVSLSKISLKKPGQSIRLEKKDAGFERITINLNWSQEAAGKTWFGGRKKIDLDLGCLWELSNGDRGTVQALGEAFGTLDQPPFIRLSGDDRTGAVADGETLLINGRQWNLIRRIAVYAFIYDGVKRWADIDGRILVSLPGHPEIEVRMDEESGLEMCGICVIENDRGALKVTRLVEYFPGHRHLDDRLDWGIRWVRGSK